MSTKIIVIGIAVLLIGSLVLFGITERSTNESSEPIKLMSVCVGEGTNTVECTFIPLDESLRTPFEKALVIKSERE